MAVLPASRVRHIRLLPTRAQVPSEAASLPAGGPATSVVRSHEEGVQAEVASLRTQVAVLRQAPDSARTSRASAGSSAMSPARPGRPAGVVKDLRQQVRRRDCAVPVTSLRWQRFARSVLCAPSRRARMLVARYEQVASLRNACDEWRERAEAAEATVQALRVRLTSKAATCTVLQERLQQQAAAQDKQQSAVLLSLQREDARNRKELLRVEQELRSAARQCEALAQQLQTVWCTQVHACAGLRVLVGCVGGRVGGRVGRWGVGG